MKSEISPQPKNSSCSTCCGRVLETDALPLTDAHRAELDYRIAQYEQGPSDVIPWEQVRAGLFKKQ